MLMWNSSGNPLNNSEWSEGPMNGEGCDLSVPRPALAGYLGNADNRGRISGTCPLCSTKGQKNVLRSYALNFEESITLCNSPLCLFPLVSEPLDNIRAILSSSQDVQGCKRKLYLTSESKDTDSSCKHWKKENTVSDVNVGDCRVSAKSVEKGPLLHDQKKQQVLNNPDERPKAFHSTCGDTVLSDDAQIKESVSSSQQSTVQDLMQMVPSLQHLFWRNKHNFCWLDSLLVALVHATILKEASYDNICSTDKFLCKNYTVKYLCATHKKLYECIKAKEQHCEDKIVRVPSNVLSKAEQDLEGLRISVFQVLQPKLQCELGQKATPAFALRLLLSSDDWANCLFQHTGQWEFRCTCCGYNVSTSMEKTVTTFTQVIADWHPLRAVHRTQCINCHNKNQKRKLVLKSMSSVLALHFVEGLPRRDIAKYEFDFNGIHYNIRTIIQYIEQRQHFVTWIHQPDGLWLEFDDLKYPHCITHRRFTIPARQFHLVFWEAESSKESQLPETLPYNTPTQRVSKVVEVFEDVTNSVPDDACIIEALTGKDPNEAANKWDSSIGNTTLLDTFEGLSHSDIVTLTLVEVAKVDAKENPLTGLKETVTGTAECSIKDASDPLEKSSFYQIPCSGKNNKGDAVKVSSTPEIIFPSVIKEPKPVDPPKVGKCPPALHSSIPSASNLPNLVQQHPFHQSTPIRVTHPKVVQKFDGNEALLAKPAEIFGGYKTKQFPIPDVSGGLLRNTFVKSPPVIKKPFNCPAGTRTTGPASTLLKPDCQDLPNSSKVVLSTEALRLKLMKRLKAKKKKLAKLNQLLDKEDRESAPRPDSTYISSPYSVTSITSACDSPPFDHFLAEFLSPDMGPSNPSPDSTGHLETLTNSQNALTLDISSQENSIPASNLPGNLLNDCSPNSDNFLEEFMSVSRDESVIDNAELNALDIFF